MRTTLYALVATVAFSSFAGCKKDDTSADSPAKPTDKAAPGGTDKPTAKPATPPAGSDKPTAEVDKPATPPAGSDKPAAGGDSVTLAFKAPATGTKWVRTKGGGVELDMPSLGHLSTVDDEQITTEVLAGTDDKVTKERVTYVKLSETQTMGGKPTDKPNPIAGKSYVLELTASGVTVTNGDGSPASDADVKAVTEKEKVFVNGDVMGHFVAGKTFDKDKKVDMPSDQVLALLGGGDDGLKQGTMSLTYQGMDGADAKFAVEASMAGDPPEQKSHIETTLSGTVEVDPATGMAVSVDLTGPVKMHRSGPFDATGTATVKETETKAP